jgi:hypothetical protein
VAYGTLTVSDSLQSLRIASGTVASFGEDRVWQAVNAAAVAHNRILADMLLPFVESTVKRLGRYGGVDSIEMEEVDEVGIAQPQKVTASEYQGLPIRAYAAALQWTRDYFKVATTEEFAANVTAIFTGDIRRIVREIKRAIFYASSYNFTDRMIDKAVLPVKALANADGFSLPVGPNAENFNAFTHTHYLAATVAWNGGATAGQMTADVTALILTVVEHYDGGDAIVYANVAQEAAIRTMTGFVPYVDSRIQQALTVNRSDTPLDIHSVYNRAIGVFYGAEVWIKPWVPSGYMFAYLSGKPKPLRMRMRGTGPEGDQGKANSIMGGQQGIGSGDLELVYENEQYPLRARQWKREFGIAPWNRTNGAVLDCNHTSYTTPTIT